MAENYRIRLWANAEGDTPTEALVGLLSQLGVSRRGSADTITLVKHPGAKATARVARKDVIHAQALAQVEASALDPANCQRDFCCRGIVRHNGKPVCQLNQEELKELTEIATELVGGLRMPGLKLVVRGLARKIAKLSPE